MGDQFIRYDKDLTVLAKELFGSDLVIKAFFTQYDTSPYGGTRDEMIFQLQVKVSERGSEGELRYDNEEIVIEFSNGRKVMFSNSEWGYMATFPNWRDEIWEVE